MNLLQLMKGFPVSPLGQKQIGFPLSSSQKAFCPQGLGSQGFFGGLQWDDASPSYPGRHLQVDWWFMVSHMAFIPHLQGDIHWPVRQASCDGQSLSERHPCMPIHSMNGLPSKPDKQRQSTPWSFGKHSALSPQESSKQGLIQILLSLSQSLFGGQSSLYWQIGL